MPDQPDQLSQLATELWELLRRLDVEMVPPSLDKVVAHSGRRLTPPLSKVLLDEVDTNEWLRSKMVEHVDTSSDPLVGAFLERPAGWWRLLAAHPGGQSDDGKLDAAVRNLERSEQQRNEAKRRLKQLRSENEALRGDLRNLRGQERRASDPQATDAARSALARNAELEAEITRLESERTSLEHRVSDLLRRRPEPLPAGPPAPAPAERRFGRGAPAQLARRLDLEFAALTDHTGAEVDDGAAKVPTVTGDDGPLRLPGGMAPDAPDAVSWLASAGKAVQFLIDGYNITYQLDPNDFRTGVARRRLIDAVAPLPRLLAAGSTVEVVFDSAEGADTEPTMSPAGVTVRFTATGVIADDDIVETVAASSLPCVVVSNDRELRSRSEAAGALALWGTALVGWLQR